jgi:hypothetical protein
MKLRRQITTGVSAVQADGTPPVARVASAVRAILAQRLSAVDR